jgi:hypothetical protein
LGWQTVDQIKVTVVAGQRGVDVATHISSYFSPISMASPSGWQSRTVCRTCAAALLVLESCFREIYLRVCRF